MSRVSVFACESQPIVLEGLAKVLSSCEDLDYVGSAPALADTFAAVRQSQPDIVLLDHSAGLKAVFEFIADVKNAAPKCQTVLWVHDLADVDCFRALRCGARGILKKTFPVTALIDCLRAVGRGDVWIEGSPGAVFGRRRPAIGSAPHAPGEADRPADLRRSQEQGNRPDPFDHRRNGESASDAYFRENRRKRPL